MRFESIRAAEGVNLRLFFKESNFSFDVGNIRVYTTNDDGALSQSLSGIFNVMNFVEHFNFLFVSADESSEESVVGSLLWQLPCTQFEGIWESLIYEDRLKNKV